MYLAKIQAQGSLSLIIRQSYFDRDLGNYRFREIFHLGQDPLDHIHIIEDRTCYFSEDLEEAVAAHIKDDPTLLLEQLLWDYLPISVRNRLSLLGGRKRITQKPLSEEDKEAIALEVHLFDRRRLYFLRYNGIDQSRLFRMHEKLCRPLLGQCRDEREYSFREQETVLSPAEYRSYVYAIFNLQHHFQEFFAPFMPEALDHDEVSDHLERDICALNSDKSFWKGMTPPTFLHSHLQRYLLMFLDFDYPHRSFTQDYARQFRDSHRKFRWPEKKTVSKEEAGTIFGRKYSELKNLTKRELTRLFREKAKKLHPDAGGDHEKFITLGNAYKDLLARLK